MANLIITIIGIALAAITVVLGLVYIGNSFDNASASAKASSLMKDLSQIYAAAQLYMTDKGQTYFETAYTSMFPDFSTLSLGLGALVPNYLSSMPTIMGARNLNTASSGNTSVGSKNFYLGINFHCTGDDKTTYATAACTVDEKKNYIVFSAVKPTSCSNASAASNLVNTFDTTDEIVKVCNKINANVDLSASTAESTTNLPLFTTSTTTILSNAFNYCKAGGPTPTVVNGCMINAARTQIIMFYTK